LANTNPNVGYEPNFPTWSPEAAMAAVGQLFAGPMESDEQWAQTWSTALPLYWQDPDSTLLADIHSRTRYKCAAWNRAVALLGEFNTAGKLDQIDVPTLLLSGKDDFITGPTAHEDMHKELPNSTLVSFENSAHFPFISETDTR